MAASRQLQSDMRLMQFNTYEDYLDSLVSTEDLRFLRSTEAARQIAEQGYRTSGETITRESFYERVAAVNEFLRPTERRHLLASESCTSDDPFIMELANRERPNRVGILSTIIFIRHRTKEGDEISGYIDYADKLATDNYKTIFEDNTRLWPQPNDLGYYHWRTGESVTNLSRNYAPLADREKGLLFQNRHDRIVICPDPDEDPGRNTTRVRIYSTHYIQTIFYDHIVRNLC